MRVVAYASRPLSDIEVKGHSRTLGPDKDGNDEAARIARLGAEGEKEWLPSPQTHAVCAVTRRKTKERCENSQSSGETLHLGRKPSDTDLATVQDQDPNLHTIRELVASGLSAKASPLATSETKELRTLQCNLSHLKLEKFYLHPTAWDAPWVGPTDHRGSC
ncbi:hypothetical protein CRENBAI_005282 [Crenichthys baileyi]|uniref:Uncharacterized protein n=1 Tax=Crenichthys baileyi TaxID=28760 RepID=A0AAV9SLT5_9TELE